MTFHGRLRLNVSLVRNMAVMYGASVGSGVIQYAALIVLARMLGPGELGVVVLTTSISSFTAAAVEFGISPVLVRFRPEIEDADPELWSGVVRSMGRIIAATAGAVVTGALLLLSIANAVSLSSNATTAVTLGLAIAAPTIILAFFQGYLQAHRRFRDIGLLNVGAALARLGLIAVLAGTLAIGVVSVLAVYLAVACSAAIAGWCITTHRAHLPPVSRATRRRARALVAPYLRWSMVGRASVSLNGRFDIFLLSILASAGTTGVYGAGYQSATPIALLGTAVGEVSFPHFAAYHRVADTRALLRQWAAWLPVLVVGSSAAAVAGAYALPVILGDRFQPSSAPFAVLVIAYGLQVWLQPIGSLLYASDRQRPAASIAVAQTVILAVLDVALIPRLGALGPALAILITTVLTAPLMVTAALRQRPSPPARRGLLNANT